MDYLFVKKQLKNQIIGHEGLELRVYHDTEGNNTIGYGRNLDGKGLTDQEKEFLFTNGKNTNILLVQSEKESGHYVIRRGRDLTTDGITQAEADFLLENDLSDAIEDAKTIVSNFQELSTTRKVVLSNMAFNMGRGSLLGFIKMREAIENYQFNLAAHEMLDSRWARIVGNRAVSLSNLMRQG